jgi:hypothetical protein
LSKNKNKRSRKRRRLKRASAERRKYEESLAILKQGEPSALVGIDLASFSAALKDIYTDDRIDSLLYANNPLRALMSARKKLP